MRGSAAIRVNVGALPVGSFILKKRETKTLSVSRSLPNVVNNGDGWTQIWQCRLRQRDITVRSRPCSFPTPKSCLISQSCLDFVPFPPRIVKSQSGDLRRDSLVEKSSAFKRGGSRFQLSSFWREYHPRYCCTCVQRVFFFFFLKSLIPKWDVHQRKSRSSWKYGCRHDGKKLWEVLIDFA